MRVRVCHVRVRERDIPFLFEDASATTSLSSSAAATGEIGGLVGTSGRSNFSLAEGTVSGTLGKS